MRSVMQRKVDQVDDEGKGCGEDGYKAKVEKVE